MPDVNGYERAVNARAFTRPLVVDIATGLRYSAYWYELRQTGAIVNPGLASLTAAEAQARLEAGNKLDIFTVRGVDADGRDPVGFVTALTDAADPVIYLAEQPWTDGGYSWRAVIDSIQQVRIIATWYYRFRLLNPVAGAGPPLGTSPASIYLGVSDPWEPKLKLWGKQTAGEVEIDSIGVRGAITRSVQTTVETRYHEALTTDAVVEFEGMDWRVDSVEEIGRRKFASVQLSRATVS